MAQYLIQHETLEKLATSIKTACGIQADSMFIGAVHPEDIEIVYFESPYYTLGDNDGAIWVDDCGYTRSPEGNDQTPYFSNMEDDVEDIYYYVGDYVIDGENFNKWVKYEDRYPTPMRVAYTNIVVGNSKKTLAELKEALTNRCQTLYSQEAVRIVNTRRDLMPLIIQGCLTAKATYIGSAYNPSDFTNKKLKGWGYSYTRDYTVEETASGPSECEYTIINNNSLLKLVMHFRVFESHRGDSYSTEYKITIPPGSTNTVWTSTRDEQEEPESWDASVIAIRYELS